MARNHITLGIVDDNYVAAAPVQSGELVPYGDLTAVALVDIATGQAGSVQLEEVFEVDCLSTDDIGRGDTLYHDTANKRVTLDDAAGANKKAGTAFAPSASGTATVQLKLNA